MNGDENTVNISQAVDAAFSAATVSPTPVVPSTLKWATPEAYKVATGKRFRLTNEEITKHGKDEAGRQAAFEARQLAGLL
jgi:hypothetical protein